MSKLIYLDNSATSFPKPDAVYDFMNSFYRTKGVSPGRSGFDAALENLDLLEDRFFIIGVGQFVGEDDISQDFWCGQHEDGRVQRLFRDFVEDVHP